MKQKPDNNIDTAIFIKNVEKNLKIQTLTERRSKDMDKIEFVQNYYNIPDDDMFELFGTDSITQSRMLRKHPEYRQAVREMDSLFSTR